MGDFELGKTLVQQTFCQFIDGSSKSNGYQNAIATGLTANTLNVNC